jgi:hypothetical protein
MAKALGCIKMLPGRWYAIDFKRRFSSGHLLQEHKAGRTRSETNNSAITLALQIG